MKKKITITREIRTNLMGTLEFLREGMGMSVEEFESAFATAVSHRDVAVAIQHKMEDILAGLRIAASTNEANRIENIRISQMSREEQRQYAKCQVVQ